MRCSRRAFVLLAALTLTPGLASALTTRRVTLAELTRTSDDVVLGTVRRSVGRWEGNFIVTDHEVELHAVLKGRLSPRSVVLLRVAGGEVGRIGQHIPGAPSLEVGATYLLFLSGGLANVRYLAHMTAAVVPMTLDASGTLQARAPESLALGAPTVSLERLVGAVRSAVP
jgi:hypothetical protein